MNSGIYAIVNKLNGNRYIGSSENIKKRWANHIKRLKNNNHHSRHLQSAWNKYGEEYFDFVLLMNCVPEELIRNEQRFFDACLPEYNVSPVAGRTSGIIRSEEYRKKQSRSQKGKTITLETRNKISEGMKGKRNSLGVTRDLSDDVKKKISKKLIGHSVSEETRIKIGSKNRNYKHTQEAKIKIGLASLGNKHASRVQSQEERKKRSDSMREIWKNKREASNV